MPVSLIDILAQVAVSNDDVVRIGNDCYGIVGENFVAIAWDASQARTILSGQIPENSEIIDVEPNMILPSKTEKFASSEITETADEFDGNPVIIRMAQWGGHGGMPPGGGSGIGGGFGISHPMSGTGNFENYIARQFFDTSLESARGPNPIANGWFRSLEDRLQDAPLYGHQRNSKDDNMLPYLMTWEERAKLKKERYLDRVRENRLKAKKPREAEPNSIEMIKATPPNPDHTESIERKLSNHRQGDDAISFRPGFHGPESEFVHYPKPEPQKRLAAKSWGKGFSIFDETTHGEEMMERMMNPATGSNAIRPKPRTTSSKGTEAGLDNLRIEPDDNGRMGPNQTFWEQNDDVVIGGGQRFHEFPYGMRGPERENQYDIGELREKYNNGHPYEYNQDLLMDEWPEGTNPGEPHMLLTQDDEERIIELMKHRFFGDEMGLNGKGKDELNSQPLEKKLTNKHHETPTSATGRAAFEWNQDPYPWANKDIYTPSSGRLWRSQGVS